MPRVGRPQQAAVAAPAVTGAAAKLKRCLQALVQDPEAACMGGNDLCCSGCGGNSELVDAFCSFCLHSDPARKFFLAHGGLDALMVAGRSDNEKTSLAALQILQCLCTTTVGQHGVVEGQPQLLQMVCDFAADNDEDKEGLQHAALTILAGWACELDDQALHHWVQAHARVPAACASRAGVEQEVPRSSQHSLTAASQQLPSTSDAGGPSKRQARGGRHRVNVLESLAEHETEASLGSDSSNRNFSVLITIALSALQHPTLAIRKAAATLFAATAATASAWAPALSQLAHKPSQESSASPRSWDTSASVTLDLTEMQVTPGSRRPAPGRHTSDLNSMDQPVLQLPATAPAASTLDPTAPALAHMPAVLAASVTAAKRLAESALQVLQEEEEAAKAGPRFELVAHHAATQRRLILDPMAFMNHQAIIQKQRSQCQALLHVVSELATAGPAGLRLMSATALAPTAVAIFECAWRVGRAASSTIAGVSSANASTAEAGGGGADHAWGSMGQNVTGAPSSVTMGDGVTDAPFSFLQEHHTRELALDTLVILLSKPGGLALSGSGLAGHGNSVAVANGSGPAPDPATGPGAQGVGGPGGATVSGPQPGVTPGADAAGTAAVTGAAHQNGQKEPPASAGPGHGSQTGAQALLLNCLPSSPSDIAAAEAVALSHFHTLVLHMLRHQSASHVRAALTLIGHTTFEGPQVTIPATAGAVAPSTGTTAFPAASTAGRAGYPTPFGTAFGGPTCSTTAAGGSLPAGSAHVRWLQLLCEVFDAAWESETGSPPPFCTSQQQGSQSGLSYIHQPHSQQQESQPGLPYSHQPQQEGAGSSTQQQQQGGIQSAPGVTGWPMFPTAPASFHHSAEHSSPRGLAELVALPAQPGWPSPAETMRSQQQQQAATSPPQLSPQQQQRQPGSRQQGLSLQPILQQQQQQQPGAQQGGAGGRLHLDIGLGYRVLVQVLQAWRQLVETGSKRCPGLLTVLAQTGWQQRVSLSLTSSRSLVSSAAQKLVTAMRLAQAPPQQANSQQATSQQGYGHGDHNYPGGADSSTVYRQQGQGQYTGASQQYSHGMTAVDQAGGAWLNLELMDAVNGGSTAVHHPGQQQYSTASDAHAVQQPSDWADDAFMAAVTAMGLNSSQPVSGTGRDSGAVGEVQAGPLPAVQEGMYEGQQQEGEEGIDEDMQDFLQAFLPQPGPEQAGNDVSGEALHPRNSAPLANGSSSVAAATAADGTAHASEGHSNGTTTSPGGPNGVKNTAASAPPGAADGLFSTTSQAGPHTANAPASAAPSAGLFSAWDVVMSGLGRGGGSGGEECEVGDLEDEESILTDALTLLPDLDAMAAGMRYQEGPVGRMMPGTWRPPPGGWAAAFAESMMF